MKLLISEVKAAFELARIMAPVALAFGLWYVASVLIVVSH